MNPDSYIYYQEPAGIIYCGDCREILPMLADKSIDLVLTDPPYGLNKLMTGGTWGRKFGDGDMQVWDYKIEQSVLDSLFGYCKSMIIWGANNYSFPPSRCWLVWEKPKIKTLSDCELAFTNLDQPSKSIYLNRGNSREGHPTMKPLALMCWCISLVTSADIILDPFLGSGTTAVAAKQLGRKFIGIEIEEKYCEIAKQRLLLTTYSDDYKDEKSLSEIRKLNRLF